ncbi:MAG: preprotein translocase subunit YajC [Pseudomonadota bacterium]|nr:preprotein translocase subunit YajC [Pseudomonadota bacterium]
MEFFIADAFAQAAPSRPAAQFFFEILPIVFLFVVLYFVMIRPQTKRNKEHKKMMEALAKGDEIVTTGGLLGRVLEVGENFVLIDVGKAVEVKVQKAQVANTVPKGTVKTL